MRLLPLLGFAFLSTGLFAQSSVVPSSSASPQERAHAALDQQKALLQKESGAGCPVGFFVQHSRASTLMQTRSPQASPRSYNVSLTGRDFKPISQAKITLFGTAGMRLMPADDPISNRGTGRASDKGPETARETYTLSPSAESKHLFRSVVFAEKITAVQWVELDEITYADGSQWHGTGDTPCRVSPSGYMLVASGQ